MAQIFKNNIAGVLAAGLSPSSTSLTLLDASAFPAPPAGDFYLLTLIGLNANGQESSWEIVKVTSKASNTLTVERAQEGTTAANWPAATTVQLRLTAESVMPRESIQSALAATAPLTHVGAGAAAHSAATTAAAGFMSGADKTKLNGIAAGANAYTHPASHPPSIIAQDASNRFVTDAEKAAWNSKAAGTHTHTAAEVGLGNVDNTSDVNKPVSTAQQAALNTKLDKTGGVLSGSLTVSNSDTVSSVSAFTSNGNAQAVVQIGLNEANKAALIFDASSKDVSFFTPHISGLFPLKISAGSGAVTSHTTGGIGYGTGAGGVATQPTSNSTLVNINKPSGVITMAAPIAAGGDAIFTVINTIVSVNDLVVCSCKGAVSVYQVEAEAAENGYFRLWVRNPSGISPSTAPVIHFAIIKGAAS